GHPSRTGGCLITDRISVSLSCRKICTLRHVGGFFVVHHRNARAAQRNGRPPRFSSFFTLCRERDAKPDGACAPRDGQSRNSPMKTCFPRGETSVETRGGPWGRVVECTFTHTLECPRRGEAAAGANG